MAEPIEIPFGMWTQMGPRNYLLDGIQIHPREGALLGDVVRIFLDSAELTVSSGPDVGISQHCLPAFWLADHRSSQVLQ